MALSSVSHSQTFCLSFGNPQIIDSGSKFQFDVFILRDGSPFQLGSSNLVFNFNTAGISSPVLISHTLNGSYDTPTVTNPLPGRASFNVVLSTNDGGIMVNETPTLLGKVQFNIINPALMSNNNWLYNGGTTETIVYNDSPPFTQLFATNTTLACLQMLNSPLPVKLVSFQSESNDKEIMLYWESTEEYLLSSYEVQRSLDGVLFSKIGAIDAKNNKNNTTYQYQDLEVKSGTKYFYRLKMLDFDGKYEYSNIISEMILMDDLVVNIYPNPVKRNMEIFVESSTSAISIIRIFDIKNSLVLTEKFDQHLTIDTKDIAPGVYYYIIENDRFTENGKIVIVD